jgi:ribosomal protein S21
MHPKQIDSILPGRLNSILVNGDLTFALKRFKRMQKDSNVILECYERKFHLKPSVANRKKMDIAKFKQSKNLG